MPSDGNSFCGDVVLDSFDMTYTYEGSILAQKYNKQKFGIYIMKIFIFIRK